MTSGIDSALIQREYPAVSQAVLAKARGETDPLLSQTVSLRTLSKRRARYVRTTAFVTFLLLLAGLSFLAAMLALMIYVPYPVIKIAAAIVILLTASHLIHVQVKRVTHLRQHIFLTSIHLQRDRRSSSARQEAAETRHLTLIKDDTMTYLKALRSEQQGVRS
ncbi:hypothetical protein KSD_73000 [Ktedonobacter sp. SOSP1-85]|uniref:hypothetical protein n=1 Tax=Ktedonobacter sp. SOSP1-85 TaxID=2778367 RepID=UPI0019158030|nr:hypothetical protein [Ktedonobacter sp. SOSP1-85]GHO79529.1 hypothetical protein KSD_73000 [Ktedonobacter sp. SOSP1-85]